ncbi:MAG: uroporphyrinogen-III C-methyltransferase [Bryobacteraceae bacterium]
MGKVYLVGAGPGDPGLITVKGRQALSRADAVLYDNLAPAALLDLAPPAAERIYVGKMKAVRAYSQDEIVRMLIDRAREGKTVVRLKGGDPYIFGRGGEEAEALHDAGIPFEVIPGVTSPLGLAAYCGVPLTHRDHTSAVTLITGHDPDRIDWQMASRSETLVVLMGLTHAAGIAAKLIAHGRSPETPAMVARWATRPDQRSLTGTLASLPSMIEAARLKPPATIVVGEVVRLAGKLNWFERLPLFGRQIVVTRAQGQAESLSGRLTALGASVIEIPAIEIRPALDYAVLDEALRRLDRFDWLVFTSANGVRHFLDRLDRSPSDLRAIRAKICAIGPATRSALESLHLKVDVTGKEYVAESLLEAMSQYPLAGRTVLLARAAVARDTLPNTLRRQGAEVVVAEAYRTVPPEGLAERIAAVFGASPRPDWITFTSSSTVDNFMQAAAPGVLAGVRVASIGPVTSATAGKWGIAVEAEAARFDTDGLAEAILSKGIIEQCDTP